MDEKKLGGAIGLAMRAGGLQSGDFIVEKLVRQGKAIIVILDSEAGANTRDKYRTACGARGIPLIEAKALGRMIGKESRMVAAVTDRRFVSLIEGALPSQQDDTNAGV